MLVELIRAINKSKPTTPGKDRVSYKMLQNLGNGALEHCCIFIIQCGRRGSSQGCG